MTLSLRQIEREQLEWSRQRPVDPARPTYARAVADNLCLERLHSETEAEFRAADGSELDEQPDRPAKMRALLSSSALAVNFFDAWRGRDLVPLGTALGLTSPVVSLCFEYKPARYPVRPRSPNLDLLLTLSNGCRVGVESKFTEPFRAPGADALISPKYLPPGPGLWNAAGLSRAQAVVARLAARWHYLDVAQLLKHMLGLASENEASSTLLYLWYDTGLEDAAIHRREVAEFAEAVAGDRVNFVSATYQETFTVVRARPVCPGWSDYMATRYFQTRV